MRDSQDYTAQTIGTESSNTWESCLQNHLGVLDGKKQHNQKPKWNKSTNPNKLLSNPHRVCCTLLVSQSDLNWIKTWAGESKSGGLEEAHQTSKSLVPSWCQFLQPGKFTNRPFCTPIMGGLVRIDYPLPSPKTQNKTTRTFTWSSCSCLVAHVPGKIQLSCRQRTGLATSQSQQRPPSFTSQGFHFMSFRNYECITYQCFRTTLTILASQQTSSTSISLRKSGGFTRIFFKPRYGVHLQRKNTTKRWEKWLPPNDGKMRRAQQQICPLRPRAIGSQICWCSGWIIAENLCCDNSLAFNLGSTAESLWWTFRTSMCSIMFIIFQISKDCPNCYYWLLYTGWLSLIGDQRTCDSVTLSSRSIAWP